MKQVNKCQVFMDKFTINWHLSMIAVIMDNLMGLVNPDGEVYTLAPHATNIARGRPIVIAR